MKPNLMFPIVSGYHRRVLKQKTLCASVSCGELNCRFPQFILPINLFISQISRYFAQILKTTMQPQEMRSKYSLRSNEYHSGAVGFSFLENNILVLW